jgi:flagellar biosynthesis chaperone FliJ
MTSPAPRAGTDLRAFRWALQPLERKLDTAVEQARLALAAAQRQASELADWIAERKLQHARDEGAAAACVRADPRLAAHANAWLATLQQELQQAAGREAELRRRVETARAQCVERQRQLACVQALRREAEREHAQGQQRRADREADAAWLARLQGRRPAAHAAEARP